MWAGALPASIPVGAPRSRGTVGGALPGGAGRVNGGVALVHAGVGSASPERAARLAAFIAGELPGLLAPGGVVAADRDLAFTGARGLALPRELDPGVYFMSRLYPAPSDAPGDSP